MPLAPRARISRPRPSGFWYTGEYRAPGSTYAPTAQHQWANAFFVTRPENFTKLGIGLNTGGSASGTYRLGVYDDPWKTGYPQSLVFEATSGGALTIGTTPGLIASSTFDLWLFPGLYWLSFKVITAGTGQALDGGQGAMPFAGPSFLVNSATAETSAFSSAVGWRLASQGTGAMAATFASGAIWNQNAPYTAIFKA